MKIAFWSNAYEQSALMHNLAAISISSVIRYPYTITVVENHLSKDNLGRAFLGRYKAEALQEVGTNYYEGGGIEALLRKIYRGENNPVLLKSYLKEIIQQHLYYIPQSGVINSELFDYEFDYNCTVLFHMIEENTDLSYIDTAPFNNLSTKTILEEADLIVVNLYQNQEYLENFFQNFSSLVPKAIFVIGNYSTKSKLSCKRISGLFNIPMDLISPVPYNERFTMACRIGSAPEFIKSNYSCSRENANYFFIQGIRKVTALIMKRADRFCGSIGGKTGHGGM